MSMGRVLPLYKGGPINIHGDTSVYQDISRRDAGSARAVAHLYELSMHHIGLWKKHSNININRIVPMLPRRVVSKARP